MKTFVSVPRGAVFDTFFTPANLELLQSLGEVVFNPYDRKLTAEEAAELIGDCEVYLTLWGSPRLDETILERAPRLRLLCHLGGTVVPFVSEAMWQAGIRAVSANAYFAESVAEGTLAYILCALRELPRYSRRLQEEKQWKQKDDYNQGLVGKTVGLVSYGEIARHVARLLSNFRVNIKVYDIKPLPEEDVQKYGLKQVGLEELFSTCDIISLHTPLMDATRHMIDRSLLSRIREGALLVNTARGGLIDQAALEEQLQSGRFRAVLDVFEQEPPPADSPLFDLPNVMMIPHMAGPTVDLRAYLTRELLQECADHLHRNAPLIHEITRERAQTMSDK